MMLNSSKIALGSANFGLDYGLANNIGKLSTASLYQIINTAKMVGIDTIDTAQAYGDSELRLGEVVKSKFEIITKIGVRLNEYYYKNAIHHLVEESLERLNSHQLYGLMIHHSEILLGANSAKIISELNALKKEGIVQKIGVSIYSPDILDKILKIMDVDIVQAPFNIFDQRIYSSGWSDMLKRQGVELHTRSVFLQGVLLMRQQDLHGFFQTKWPNLFDAWYQFQKKLGLDSDEIALAFALERPWIDKVVVGVDSVEHLKRLSQIENQMNQIHDPGLESNDLELIDPSNWKFK